jgi:hypothetical protein
MIPRLVDLEEQAQAEWDDLPRDGGHASFAGTPMTHREAEFRRQFVEPMALRINTAYKAGEISIEDLRLAHNACLGPIPSRRRFSRRLKHLTELEAISELFKRGIACRSSEQVAAGAMTDLPWVGDIAAANGITLVDPDDEEEPLDPDAEVEDIEGDLL